MTLLEKVQALPEITPQAVREVVTFEDFKFEILNAINSQGIDYDNLSTMFSEVDELIENQSLYNIFSERLAVKVIYLFKAYNLDFTLLQALLVVEPLVKLDKELEVILQEDSNFIYIKEAFKEYKINNGLTLATVMKYMSTLDLTSMMDKLKDNIGDLNKIAQSK